MKRNIRLISDFNINTFAGMLRADPRYAQFEIEAAEYGQVYQELHKPSESWMTVVWASAQRTLPNFYEAMQLTAVSHEEVLSDVETFARAIIDSNKSTYTLVCSWVLPHNFKGYGMLDWRDDLGVTNLLAKCNLLLSQILSEQNNIFLLDTQSLINLATAPYSNKMWFAAKVPFSAEVFQAAANRVANCIAGIEGRSRRLIVLDLDNTLWGGVVGEHGWPALRLGGHDHKGEAFKDFQLGLKALSNRGIQLAIASKNDENVALEAIDKNPEMVLQKRDFVGWRINWDDKAKNIIDLVDELNLGMGSVVFIDDNPAERMRVDEAIPEIFVPAWPADPAEYLSALWSLDCFEAVSLSAEDRQRTAMYVAEKSRRQVQQASDGSDAWMKKLATTVTVTSVSENNIARVTQLFNKTNQLNLSTRRLSEREILEWFDNDNRAVKAISVTDRFGDLGLVGIIGIEADEADGTDVREGRLIDFILSCRVMGRGVEDTLLHIAISELRKLKVNLMRIQFIPTERNRPTLEVLQKSRIQEAGEYQFYVDVDGGYDKPDTIELIWE